MTRHEFLKQLGFQGAALMALYCAGACQEEHVPVCHDCPVDFTIDLNDPEFMVLKSESSFIITQSIVVAHTSGGKYVAASIVCSHAGVPQVTFDPKRSVFSCSAHGAEFDLEGKGLNELGKKGLRIFQTSLDDTMLRIVG
jgi:nitrite reductase/ring-hydroxylating ferredoxin subunit